MRCMPAFYSKMAFWQHSPAWTLYMCNLPFPQCNICCCAFSICQYVLCCEQWAAPQLHLQRACSLSRYNARTHTCACPVCAGQSMLWWIWWHCPFALWAAIIFYMIHMAKIGGYNGIQDPNGELGFDEGGCVVSCMLFLFFFNKEENLSVCLEHLITWRISREKQVKQHHHDWRRKYFYL